MQGEFSFDGLFGNLVNEILPSYQEEESDAAEGHDALPNGNLRTPPDAGKSAQGMSSPLFLKLMIYYLYLRIRVNNWLISENRYSKGLYVYSVR